MGESSTVRVAWTVEQRAEKADEMARLLAVIAGIEDEAKAKAKKFRDEVAARMAELQTIGAELREGAEAKAQLDLFVDQTLAGRDLAEVAKHLCSCPGGPGAEVKSPSCRVHGVDAQPIRVPLCECKKPATCIGHYDGDVVEGDVPSCDDCCSHSQKDGHCEPITTAAPEPTVAQETTDGAAAMAEPSGEAGEAQAGEAAAETTSATEPDALAEAPTDDDGAEMTDEEYHAKFPNADPTPGQCDGSHEPPPCSDPQCVVDAQGREVLESDARGPVVVSGKGKRKRLAEDDGPGKAA
jgi:hypothetical protein